MRKLCPNCFKFITLKKGETECPFCHNEVVKKKEQKTEIKTSFTKEPEPNIAEPKLSTAESNDSQTNDKKTQEAVATDKFHQKNGRIKWVPKHLREENIAEFGKVKQPRVSGVHIDVESSSYFAKSRNKYKPSTERIVIQNNGKYELEKLKWWEIYKWADRQLAKNKIKKAVRKESLKRPERVSFWTLLCLCLFSGFLGVHNFYAGNFKKGLVSAISFSLAMIYVVFLDGIAFFNVYMQGLLCALPGLICLLIWFADAISIIFKRFKFATSKLAYIKTLDLETRARLGKKYIYIV